MKGIIRVLLQAVMAGASTMSFAGGIALVVNPGSNAGSLSADQVKQVYLGRMKVFSDGSPIVPIDMPEGTPLRLQFLERVIGKTEQQMRSFWTREIFTGKGQPPRTAANAADLLRIVGSTPGAVGYVETQNLTPSMKVIFRVD